MSRPITLRRTIPAQTQFTEGTIVEDAWFLREGFGGVMSRASSSGMTNIVPRTHLINTANVVVSRDNRLVLARGLSTTITSGVGNYIVGAYGMSGDSSTIVYVVTINGVWRSTVGTFLDSFVQLTGPSLTGSGITVGDQVSFLPWSHEILLFTSPQIGVYAINLTTQTYAKVTDAPIGAGHIILMNGRVVLSGFLQYPQRVQWSAQFDYEDWTGLGSGFEDLIPADMGGTSPALGVWTFADTYGLVIRQRGVDSIEATDNFDAPFRFKHLHWPIQCYHPRGIVRTRRSLVVASYKEFLEITPDGVEVISNDIEFPTSWTGRIFGIYHRTDDSVWMYGSNFFNSIFNAEPGGWIWVYNLRTRAFTQIASPNRTNGIHTLTFIGGPGGASYDDLSGTYDAQVGSMHELSIAGLSGADEFAFATYNENCYEYRPGAPASGFGFEFPAIEPTQNTNWVTALSFELFFTMNETDYEVTIQYSVEKGIWNTYATMNLGGPGTSLKHRTALRTVSGPFVAFRVLTAGTPNTYDLRVEYARVQYTSSMPARMT